VGHDNSNDNVAVFFSENQEDVPPNGVRNSTVHEYFILQYSQNFQSINNASAELQIQGGRVRFT